MFQHRHLFARFHKGVDDFVGDEMEVFRFFIHRFAVDDTRDEIASIGEVDVFDAGKKAINAPGITDGIETNLKLIIDDPSKLETNANGKEAAVFIRQFQKFLPAGFVPDLVNAPVTTHMGVLEAARKYTGSLVKGYDPKKPGPVPIVGLISAYYMIEVVSVTFKNAIILEYINIAFQKVKPKLKA